MTVLIETAFTLVIGDRPVLSFIARNQFEAWELAREAWLREELTQRQSEGRPLWDGRQKLSVRRSSADESALLVQARSETNGEDGIVFAYLVELDNTPPTSPGD